MSDGGIERVEQVGPVHQGPLRRLVLADRLSAREITSLDAYCRRLREIDRRGPLIDLSAVTSCDRAGLAGLTALTGRDGRPAITVTGVRWSQFMTMLSLADVRELDVLCDDVRALRRPIDEHPT